jgi:hypothetical protein
LKEKMACLVNERRGEGCAAEALVLSAEKELETRLASVPYDMWCIYSHDEHTGSIAHPFTYHVTSLLLYHHGMVCPQRKQLEDWLAENRTALSSIANRTAHSGTEIGLLEQTLRFLSQQQVRCVA